MLEAFGVITVLKALRLERKGGATIRGQPGTWFSPDYENEPTSLESGLCGKFIPGTGGGRAACSTGVTETLSARLAGFPAGGKFFV